MPGGFGSVVLAVVLCGEQEHCGDMWIEAAAVRDGSTAVMQRNMQGFGDMLLHDRCVSVCAHMQTCQAQMRRAAAVKRRGMISSSSSGGGGWLMSAVTKVAVQQTTKGRRGQVRVWAG
jgi:hypothetical protein